MPNADKRWRIEIPKSDAPIDAATDDSDSDTRP